MVNTVFFWICMSALFVCLELTHPIFFFFLSFAGGACLAAGAALWGFSQQEQAITFLVGSCIVFAFLKIWLKRRHNFKHSHHQSNAYALIGKEAMVIAAIDATNPGYVKIEGQEWLARTAHHEKIGKGSSVKVMNVVGCHLIVRPHHVEEKL